MLGATAAVVAALVLVGLAGRGPRRPTGRAPRPRSGWGSARPGPPCWPPGCSSSPGPARSPGARRAAARAARGADPLRAGVDGRSPWRWRSSVSSRCRAPGRWLPASAPASPRCCSSVWPPSPAAADAGCRSAPPRQPHRRRRPSATGAGHPRPAVRRARARAGRCVGTGPGNRRPIACGAWQDARRPAAAPRGPARRDDAGHDPQARRPQARRPAHRPHAARGATRTCSTARSTASAAGSRGPGAAWAAGSAAPARSTPSTAAAGWACWSSCWPSWSARACGRARAGRSGRRSPTRWPRSSGSARRWRRVLLFVVGVVLMTTEAHPEARPRLVVGSALLALGALGLVHIGIGLPTEPERWHEGGGAVGYLAAIPLATGLTVWVAVPVLLLLSAYAFLLLIDTPLREVPDLLRRLIGPRRSTTKTASPYRPTTTSPTRPCRTSPPRSRPAAGPARRRQGVLRRAVRRRRRATGGTRRARAAVDEPPAQAPPPRSAGAGHPAGRDGRRRCRRAAASGDARARRRHDLHAAAERPAAHRVRRRAPAAARTTRSSRRSPACSSSSTSTRRSPASPGARPSPATRSSSARP